MRWHIQVSFLDTYHPIAIPSRVMILLRDYSPLPQLNRIPRPTCGLFRVNGMYLLTVLSKQSPNHCTF
jgi:hypothetical protein